MENIIVINDLYINVLQVSGNDLVTNTNQLLKIAQMSVMYNRFDVSYMFFVVILFLQKNHKIRNEYLS